MLSISATRLARLTRCLRHYSLAEQAIFSTHVSDAMLKFPWGKIDEHSTDICGCGLPAAADMSFTDPTSQKRRPAGRLGGLMESDVALSQSREVEECL